MKRIALALTLTACGNDDDAAKQTAPAPVGTVATSAPASMHSIALNTVADLPACTVTNETQLAYVADVRLFYVCTLATWKEVDISGPAGADGKDGAAGADGKDGVDGTNGKDGAPSPRNVWTDPFTGRLWYLGGAIGAAGNCTGATRSPTNDEAMQAVEHGLFVALGTGGIQDMWTTSNQVVNSSHAYAPTSGMHGNFCIKEDAQ